MNASVSTRSPRWMAVAQTVLASAIRVSLFAALVLTAVAAIAGVGLHHPCICIY